jgi:hypothetical protein
MNYTISHGRIAAIQYITTPTGEQFCAIYQSEQKQPEAYPEGNMSRDIWDTLPLPVQAAINRQFGIVFFLPYSARENFVLNSIPFEVAA